MVNVLATPLFAVQDQGTSETIGVGFHNIGSGVLRASARETIDFVEAHYGERCGHLPLNASEVRILVPVVTPEIRSHTAYLSSIFGKTLKATTAAGLRQEQEQLGQQALVVPYVNVPEAERHIKNDLGATPWGLPGKMVEALKNKASFYQLLDEFNLNDFQSPDYRVVHIADLPQEALRFLGTIEELLAQAGITNYPLGIVLRAAESDGNYGNCIIHKQGKHIAVVCNGDAAQMTRCTSWEDAFALAQNFLATTMNHHMETRIVMSRYLDLADSPGLSVVCMHGQVESLGWNGQLQLPGSKACVGTSSYRPATASLARTQQEYEVRTAAFLEALLRETAHRCDLDFASLRGIANIDIMLPGPAETRLQQRRGHPHTLYIAECNPRWTNYTDAIMTIIGANQKLQTVGNMRATIAEGLCTFDKFVLQQHVDPAIVRERIFERDSILQQNGTRIICRMTHNPLGLILAGDLDHARQEVDELVQCPLSTD